jgi:hypothetical protein
MKIASLECWLILGYWFSFNSPRREIQSKPVFDRLLFIRASPDDIL